MLRNKKCILNILTKEFLQAALLENNGSPTKIANKLNISIGTIKYNINKYKLSNKKKRFKVELNDQDVWNYYNECKNVQKTASYFKCDSGVIKENLLNNNKKLFVKTWDDNFFSEDNEKSFYWAGFIAADGCINSFNNIKTGKLYQNLQISISTKDKDFLQLFCNDINYNKKITDSVYHNKNHILKPSHAEKYYNSSISISSDKMVNDLNRFGIGPRKSLTYEFPKHFINHELIHHFMRGYNDGDGSFYLNNIGKQTNIKIKQVCFCLCGTQVFLKDYLSILTRECNMKYDAKHINPGSIYTLDLRGNKKLANVYNYLYKDATIFLTRKEEMAKNCFLSPDQTQTAFPKLA